MLAKVVAQCGGMTESLALDQATQVLKAEAQLANACDVPTVLSLLKICGHMTGSKMINSRRKAMRARTKLLSISDISTIRRTLQECSELDPCYITRSIQDLLKWDDKLQHCHSEQDLFDGISLLSGRLTGSENLLNAIRRYGKFQRYQEAMDGLSTSTDAAILVSCLRSFSLYFLFEKLDSESVSCVRFEHILQAILELGLEPQVDAKKAADQLFPSAPPDPLSNMSLIVFLHLAFNLDVHAKVGMIVDGETVTRACNELGLTSSGVLAESVLGLCSQGGPRDPIYFRSFDSFLSDQMHKTSKTPHSLRALIPDERWSLNLQAKYEWVCALAELEKNNDYRFLQELANRCNNLTGSKLLDDVQMTLKAAEQLQHERARETIVQLLDFCGHLENCKSVMHAKNLIEFDNRFQSVTNLSQAKFLVHACKDLESESMRDFKAVLTIHEQLEKLVAAHAAGLGNNQKPSLPSGSLIDNLVSDYSASDLGTSKLMILLQLYHALSMCIQTVGNASAASNEQSLKETLLTVSRGSPAEIKFLIESISASMTQREDDSDAPNLVKHLDSLRIHVARSCHQICGNGKHNKESEYECLSERNSVL